MNAAAAGMGSPGSENENALSEEYGDEVMFSGWNPQVAAAVELSLAVFDEQVALVSELVNADIDSVLERIYKCQC